MSEIRRVANTDMVTIGNAGQCAIAWYAGRYPNIFTCRWKFASTNQPVSRRPIKTVIHSLRQMGHGVMIPSQTEVDSELGAELPLILTIESHARIFGAIALLPESARLR